MINIEELDIIVKQIEAHPETWQQATWAVKTACGTAYCVAGHAVVRAGYKIVWEGDKAVRCIIGGHVDTIPDVAQELLGLTDAQAALLFAAGNRLDAIKELIDEWR